MTVQTPHTCPCCGYLTLDEEPPGSYQCCPVCWWEDDLLQFGDPSYKNGANSVNLEEARRNFATIGAIDEESLAHVRPPLSAEKLV